VKAVLNWTTELSAEWFATVLSNLVVRVRIAPVAIFDASSILGAFGKMGSEPPV